MLNKPNFHVEIYQGRALFGGQRWRWRAIANNYERLAQGEAYRNKLDLLETVWDLFGNDVVIKERGVTVVGLPHRVAGVRARDDVA